MIVIIDPEKATINATYTLDPNGISNHQCDYDCIGLKLWDGHKAVLEQPIDAPRIFLTSIVRSVE